MAGTNLTMSGAVKLLFLLLLPLIGCKNTIGNDDLSKWKSEIMEVEQSFNDMAQKEGLAEAFHFYSAEDGVIRRNSKIIEGKEAISEWYKKDVRPNETLTWRPTFVEVSASGDMAYTYGNYTFTSTDSLGNIKESTGIFHTVWKRQVDGTWRFVWD